MGAKVVYEDSDTFEDGSRYEMIATAVPETDDYPEGIKYHARTFYDEMDDRRER